MTTYGVDEVPTSSTGYVDRLKDLDVELPAPRSPGGNYVPWVKVGNLLFVSGQGSHNWRGRLGDDLSVADGQKAARECAVNLLAQLDDALGSIDKVKRIVKLTGFVRCTGDFTQSPAVVNGASDLLIGVFGESGAHARSAIGVQSLPKGIAVEVEMIAEAA
jgi:enamine deaminase RidA (YjgF/YER057c/UK114 family)